ncbi:MAG: hypothetical protein Q7Q71_15465 [Verrucomicrobiota bacterium JB023]|nr:hypothetical protein [Verrucomicrobiota bacterium JB023]
MAGKQNRPRTQSHSPFAGCSIIIVAIVMMVFLVGFTIWSLFKVDAAITEFTQDEAVQTIVPDPAQYEKEFNDLSRRLEGFASNLSLGKKAELELTPLDLNLAIASYDRFKALRHTFSVAEIKEDEVAITIAYQLGSRPLGEGKPRYLNGTMYGVPRLDTGHILLDLSRIDSLKGEVPEQFVAQLSDHQITAPYLEDKTIGPYLKQLTRLELTPGALIVEADPATAPPTSSRPAPTKDEAIFKFTSIFLVALVVFGLFLFFFLRSGKGRAE